ncbi:MAG: 30S ribosomal protein S11 [Verrucomicrobia bacterium]|nr:MAG: 30S ribosomal protein S11 [Verrucomicrobiota bacterium]
MAEEKEQKEKKETAKPAKAEKAPKAEKTAKTAAPVAEAAAPAPVAEGAAAPAEGDAAKAAKVKKVKGGRVVPVGIVFIRASFNNTIVTITDMKGAVVAWSSAGRCQFKGSRKSTAYAATVVAQEAAKMAVGHGLREAEVHVQGPGAGRESAIRAIQSAGIAVTCIKDITPIPHNGCRPAKARRV